MSLKESAIKSISHQEEFNNAILKGSKFKKIQKAQIEREKGKKIIKIDDRTWIIK